MVVIHTICYDATNQRCSLAFPWERSIYPLEVLCLETARRQTRGVSTGVATARDAQGEGGENRCPPPCFFNTICQKKGR